MHEAQIRGLRFTISFATMVSAIEVFIRNELYEIYQPS